jgi:DNA polymerase III delta subunit
LQQLIRAVELCTEADFKMKSSAQDQRELLKEVVLRIAAGEKTHAKS